MTATGPTDPPGGSTADSRPVCQATEHLLNPYIAAGDRLYVVGAQDGTFPAHGWHIPGEMGGVWAHPIKLADGFALAIDGVWGPVARVFHAEPMRTSHSAELSDGATIERSEWVPDGEPVSVIRYAIRSTADRTAVLMFAVAFDLRPVWPEPDWFHADPGLLRAGYTEDLQAWECGYAGQPWSAIAGCLTHAPRAWALGPVPANAPVETNGLWVTLEVDVLLTAGATTIVEFAIGGDARGEPEAASAYRRVATGRRALEAEKFSRYDALLSHSRIEILDPSIGRAWDWLKANNDWLVRDVPGVGRGLGAGADDFVWWFGCDTAFAVLGCLALSQPDIAVETIDLIRDLSARANGPCGRVLHEANTRGEVVHPGLTQETPHLAATTWDVFRWTGDRAFLERMYPFCKTGVLDWTLGEQCRDGELLPYGYAITEVEGMDLQLIDSAVHTVTALRALEQMAGALGDPDTAARCGALAPRVQRAMDEAFWMEDEGMYGDMLATPREMRQRIGHWISLAQELSVPLLYHSLVQLQSQVNSDPSPDVKRPWLLGYWVVMCPMLAGLTDAERASRSLDRLAGPEFSGPHGMYLNAMARTQAMGINTGALAETMLRYGRVEQALIYLRQIADVLSLQMPGAISEYLPDEGCFVQAWSGYAVAWPLVTQVFGLQPDAHERRIRIEPHVPEGWEGASLRNVRVGSTAVDLEWDGRGMAVTVHEPGWSVISDSVPLTVEVGR